ncbi:hypothetical protein HKD37_04G009059 [Glycine soja]
MRKMFSNTTSGARATTLRVIGALIAMPMLIWSTCYGHQATRGPQRHPLDQWISWVGALIMISGFLLLALGIPVIAGLFLRLLEELQYQKENGIHQSGKPKEKLTSFVVIEHRSPGKTTSLQQEGSINQAMK